MRRYLEDLGPVLAGFSIATKIVGFFGIGAIAKWLLVNWIPFTRWVWSEILFYINLPEITPEEKDSLTTLAFFAPMAISAIISVIWKSDAESGQTRMAEDDRFREFRLRIYAALCGVASIVIMGGGVIQDGLRLLTTDVPVDSTVVTPEEASRFTLDYLLSKDFLASAGLFFGAIFLIAIITAGIALVAFRFAQGRKIFEDIGARLLEGRRMVGEVATAAMWQLLGAATGLLANLIALGSMFAGVAYAASELGPIRVTSVVVVLVSLFVTVVLNPSRLLRTAGVVIALIVASLFWDVGLWIVHAVENAPKT